MEAGCWVLGGEFEDSVFEQSQERRHEPPAPYRAKLCEPQVRRLPSCRSAPEPARGEAHRLHCPDARLSEDCTHTCSHVLQAGPG